MRVPTEKELSGLGREDLLKLIRALHGELKAIDDLLFDSTHMDVEHQIDCHKETLSQYTRHLAETLKKIEAVGAERYKTELDALEESAKLL